ncbi:hypothetical protein EJ02DRAFT_462030 [Clathrospora elynae]|uniref:Uncharacterized protein n=1 Tax=Clathrospora elynae TaxID=706981 RepID=A0A6A5T4I7_9PLEO|nr:hypothetical protein EJ02DRAFT_462030 [Clathrospora elynae]
MFVPNPFGPDPFNHRLPIPSSLSYTNYMVPHLERRTHEPRTHPSYPQPPHTRRQQGRQHRPRFSGSEFSDEDTTNDAYYLDDESSLNDRQGGWRAHYQTDMEPNLRSSFKRTHIELPSPTADLLSHTRTAILILPPTLTHLLVQIRSSHHGTETVRAAVAGDMRFRDVVKQMVPANYTGEVRAYVKLRGVWQEPGGVRVSELVEQGRYEIGEMEVKIEVGGREGRGGGVGGVSMGMGHGGGMKRGVKAWEREMGRTWEIRG